MHFLINSYCSPPPGRNIKRKELVGQERYTGANKMFGGLLNWLAHNKLLDISEPRSCLKYQQQAHDYRFTCFTFFISFLSSKSGHTRINRFSCCCPANRTALLLGKPWETATVNSLMMDHLFLPMFFTLDPSSVAKYLPPKNITLFLFGHLAGSFGCTLYFET